MDEKIKDILVAGSVFVLLCYRIYSQKQLKKINSVKEISYAEYLKTQTQTRNKKRSSSFAPFEQERKKVVVQVPATSANLGSGYDCVGMALDLWNELSLERSETFKITAEGEGASELPLDKTNYVVKGVEAAFKAAGKPIPPLHYHLKQKIPHGRGLGSSSAAIVAGIIAGLAITGHRLQVQGKEGLLQLATEIEGHPDNVAPAMYGGVQIGLYNEDERRWATERLPIPHGLKFVMFIPTFVGKTSELREVVPKTVPLKDAVYNMSRLAWFINALNTGKVENIKEGVKDRLHQPYRGKAVYKHLEPLMKAAYEAGAVGSYLSGAGPVVMAMTTGGSGDYFTQLQSEGIDVDLKVAEAMTQTARKIGVDGRVYITHPSNTGGVVTFADPPYSNPLVTFNGET
eukprot:augustus_masked-scaffold_15-processed-gene-1.39-mRNA-1 protein AED:0.33 eAED:0.33 QI:0/-1/0/1/-1/1/1/0/400